MPWTETSPVDERQRFIVDVRAGLYSMTELCARYGISRTSGYKWVARADAGGRQALADRSRAPHHCPHRISAALAELLCTTRRAHPLRGPKKQLQYLAPHHRRIAHWPAVSTVGDLLVREGLVTKRRRRRRAVHPGAVPPCTTAPNDLWAADFKGQFCTGDGIYCYPLSITDQHSRFLLTCHSLRNVQTVGAIRPPRATLPAQQRAFDVFRREHNEVRPHDTLEGCTPASAYQPSPRSCPRRLPLIDYPGHDLVKRIMSGGTFHFGRRLLFLATPLEGYDVGLDEVEDGIWSIYFCTVLIARFDERDHVIRS